jgi:hypothetical protein
MRNRITSDDITRVLFLDGEEGHVACRVHGSLIANPFPHLSPEYRLESSLRSRARLRNLVAVRGILNEGMVGPGDYYGNWERPDKYFFSISIEKGFPSIYQHTSAITGSFQTRQVGSYEITEVKACWTSGKNKTEIEAKRQQYKANSLTGYSLFKNVGILEIEEIKKIKLKQFDATQVDLSPFKARLVENHRPFKIMDYAVAATDEWRAVSYQFDPGHANRQVTDGNGLFLETHNFAQSMTPLDQSAGGFVTLAKWKHEVNETLQIIGIKIPFGYTLLVDKGCIHGDTTLNGMYMMCMTSNHTTMSSADTVFLKQAEAKQNIDITLEGEPSLSQETVTELSTVAPKPVVIYNDDNNFDMLDREARKFDVMVNPFSTGWWNHVYRYYVSNRQACNQNATLTEKIIALPDGDFKTKLNELILVLQNELNYPASEIMQHTMIMLNATEKLLKNNSVNNAVEQQKLCEIFLAYESQCAAHCRSSEMKTLIINIITAGIIFALGAPVSLSTFAMDVWSGTSAAIANIRNMISHSVINAATVMAVAATGYFLFQPRPAFQRDSQKTQEADYARLPSPN